MARVDAVGHKRRAARQIARVTLAVRFDGLLGGVMGRKMADLNHRYLAMEAAGPKRFSEKGPRDPSVSLETWSADAVRALSMPR